MPGIMSRAFRPDPALTPHVSWGVSTGSGGDQGGEESDNTAGKLGVREKLSALGDVEEDFW
jgi:hypothetical protein